MSTIKLVDANNIFRRRFEAGYDVRRILDWINTDPLTTIWVWDGGGAKRRRLDLYPEYKSKRNKPGDDFWRFQDWFKTLLPHSRAISVEVPYYEADDVIATMVQSPDLAAHNILIDSNDGDYLQLCDFTRVNMSQDIKLKGQVPKHEIRLYKTLVGDSSDFLPGIKLFGDKAWEALTQRQKAEWTTWLEAGDPKAMFPDCLKPSQHLWVASNAQLLINLWHVAGFFEVPRDLINKHTVVGVYNPMKTDKMLEEFFL